MTLEWTRPLGLTALLLPLLVLLLARSGAAAERLSGTVVLWQRVAAPVDPVGARRRRRLPPGARWLALALAAGALALGGPVVVPRSSPRTWTVVVDRSPSMYLPAGAGTRLDGALAEAHAALADLRTRGLLSEDDSVRWLSPGEDRRQTEGGPPAAWREPPAAARSRPDPLRWDRPGVLLVTDRAPGARLDQAGLAAGGGPAVFGTVGHLHDSRGWRSLVWDAAELREESTAGPDGVWIDPALDAVWRELAVLWAAARGWERVPDRAAAGVLAITAAETDAGAAFGGGTAGGRVRLVGEGWWLTGSRIAARAPADQDAVLVAGSLDAGPDRPVVWAGPGRVHVALERVTEEGGDPAALAVALARLFDGAARGPGGSVPALDRRAAESRSRPPRPPLSASEEPRNPRRLETALALLAAALAAVALDSVRRAQAKLVSGRSSSSPLSSRSGSP